jgi:hypothetical protein
MIVLCPVVAALAFPRLPTAVQLSHGRRLVAFAHWSTSTLAGNSPYQWLPGNRIIMKGDDGVIRIIDVARQTDVRVGAIDSAYRRDPDLVKAQAGGPPSWVASPDGRWVLSYAVIAGHGFWIAGTVDGKRLVKLPLEPLGVGVIWNATSDGWTEVWRNGPTDEATRYYLDGRKPETVDLYALTPVFDYLRPLGPIGPDRILLSLPMVGPVFHAFALRLDRPGVPPTAIRYRIRRFAWIGEEQLSPDGDRIAWLLIRPADETMLRIRRMLPFGPTMNFRVRKEIWVSRLDGSQMRPLAAGDPMERNAPSPDQPQFIRWTPDGKSISYLYKGAIWAVPAG